MGASVKRLSDEERQHSRAQKNLRNRENIARKRDERIAAGFCPECGKFPPESGHRFCAVCLDVQRKASLKLRQKRVASKRCRRCDREQDRDVGVCSACLESERAQYAERVRLSLCVKCGNEASEGRQRCERCAKAGNERTAKFKDRLKRDVFERYGGARCVCCGEVELVFLAIDHVGGGGSKHRTELNPKNVRGGGGHTFYAWLKRQGFPPGYQVLCFNCNFAKWKLGRCPHQDRSSAK